MSELDKDPYRAILAMHVEPGRVSMALLHHAELLWFTSVAIPRNGEHSPEDWNAIRPLCQHVFRRVERIIIDNRPWHFLRNMYSNFQADTWKFVFIDNNLLRYKFRLVDAHSAEAVALEWLHSMDQALALPVLLAKFSAYEHRASVAMAILIYLTFITPEPHARSEYRPNSLQHY